MKYKLLITEPEGFSQDARDLLDAVCDVSTEHIEYEGLISTISNFEIIFIRLGIKFDRVLLRNGEKLKYIVSPTTGLDHIDLQAAHAYGIKVLSLKGESEFLKNVTATAELAWGLILSLARYIPWAFDDVRHGNWNRDLFKGHELAGKRLGILGLGRLGEIVAKYGNAFGMKVSAFDPYREDWIPGIERANSLKQLLSNSDILSIHVPLNPETNEMLGDEELILMPQGAWIINTSRGKIINEDALLKNLNSGHLGGAGLDVLADELTATDWPTHNKLVQYSLKNRNLIITPHTGGATIESMHKTELFMTNKLVGILNSENVKES